LEAGTRQASISAPVCRRSATSTRSSGITCPPASGRGCSTWITSRSRSRTRR
jgi:hypothetical protein